MRDEFHYGKGGLLEYAMYLGIDFGTSNSALAVAEGGNVRDLVFRDGRTTQRSVMFFPNDRKEIIFGNEGMQEYEESGMNGRLVQSIKRHLSAPLEQVMLGGKTWELHELAAAYLRFLREQAQEITGVDFRAAVIGRPVRFHEEDEWEVLAARRLEHAARQAGFERVAYQYEPIAAALDYERTVEREEIVFVGDFGGGTSDFAVVRVGPGRGLKNRAQDVLSISGVPVAGDALDTQLTRAELLPFFGKGITYSLSPGLPQQDWNPSLLYEVTNLYRLPFLKTRENRAYLHRMIARVSDPDRVRWLEELIFHDMGFSLARAVECAKIELSSHEEAHVHFHEGSISIDAPVTRWAFERASERIVAQMETAIDQALRLASIGPVEVSHVFLTGGTSQVPFVRDLFVKRFGEGKILVGDVFTSVSKGMALSWPLLTQ